MLPASIHQDEWQPTSVYQDHGVYCRLSSVRTFTHAFNLRIYRTKDNWDLQMSTARCLGFVIASYFIIKTKQINNLNLYPSINERTTLLLSYILSPSLTRSEREGLLLKYEASGIMDAYIRRGKLGFNIGNNDSLISTDYSACRCNCSKCSAFANEICNKAKPLNSEVLNHMSIYTECFPKNKVFTPFLL